MAPGHNSDLHYARAESIDEMAESDNVGASAISGPNIYVVWEDFTPGNYDILLRRSDDNGATWKAIVNLSGNPGKSTDPKVAASGSNVYVIWKQANAAGTSFDVFFRKSQDNGATWGSKVNLSTTGDLPSLSTPELAISGTNVYVVWVDTNPGNSDILFRRSTDNGATWKTKVNLSSNPGPSDDPKTAASGSNVYVAWRQSDSSSSTDAFFRRSTDNGATWKSRTNLSNSGVVFGEPALAVSGPRVYLAWLDSTEFEYVVKFKRSTNSGASLGSALVFFPGIPEEIGAVPPELEATGTNVYLKTGFRDTFTTCGGLDTIYLDSSTNSGSSFSSTVELADGHIGFGDVEASGSNVYFVYSESRELDCNSPGQSEVYFRKSTNNGATFGTPKNLSANSGDSFRPVMAVSGSRIFVVWPDDTPGNSDILLRRSTNSGDTWKSKVNLSSNSGLSTNPQV
jgi:hypothetical protein